MGLPGLGGMAGSEIASFFIGIAKKILPSAQSAIAEKLQASPHSAAQLIGDVLETPEMRAELEKAIKEKQDFMTTFEGSMADLTEWGKNLRSSVRPILTYAFTIIFLVIVVIGASQALLGYDIVKTKNAYQWLSDTKFILFTGFIIGWWFLDRGVQKWLGRTL